MPLAPAHEYAPPRLETEQDEIAQLDRDAAQLHQAIRDAVDEVGPKDCAWMMKRDASTLSNWVNERPDTNGTPRLPPAKLLLLLGKKQESQRLARLLSRLWGYIEPERPKTLTPEEELKHLKATLAEGGDVGALFLAKANARGGPSVNAALSADIVALLCPVCGAVVSICQSERPSPMLERHIVQACAGRERIAPALFAQLAARLNLYVAHAVLWRGQVGRA